MFVRSPFNYDGDVVSFQSGVDFSDAPSRAQQHFRDETDINVMVARFQRTGVPEAPPVFPDVQDFTQSHDFRSAMDVIVEARHAFSSVPAKVRDRFLNDPGLLLEFLADPDNRDEAERLGLVVQRHVVQPDSIASSVVSKVDSSVADSA